MLRGAKSCNGRLIKLSKNKEILVTASSENPRVGAEDGPVRFYPWQHSIQIEDFAKSRLSEREFKSRLPAQSLTEIIPRPFGN